LFAAALVELVLAGAAALDELVLLLLALPQPAATSAVTSTGAIISARNLFMRAPPV
jgi:hypothetical protein